MEIHIRTGDDHGKKFLKMEDTIGGHYGIVLDTRKKEDTRLSLVEEDVGILFMEVKRDNCVHLEL